MDLIIDGLGIIAQPASLALLLGGLCVGFIVGVLPGLGTSTTVALLLPVTLFLPVEHSLILIVSIYAGAAFGGAIPAILVNVPGEAGSAVTALDGYPMAKQGKAGLAIGIARGASSIGGLIAGLIVLAAIGTLGKLALSFGAREMVLIVLLALVITAALMGDSLIKGLTAGALGIVIATIGADPLTGRPRLTFGVPELYDGIQLVPFLIGLFAIGEMLYLGAQRAGQTNLGGTKFKMSEEYRDAVKGVRETLRQPRALASATGVGVLLGSIPGIGSGVSSFMSYAMAKRFSRHPERFGKGSPEGVVAAEACDNAATSATLIPTFALGVPGSATMALVLAQFQLQGIQTGPRIMETHADVVYASVLALIIASILILPIGVLFSTPLTVVTRVPNRFLIPAVLIVAAIGAYVPRLSLTDVIVAFAIGTLALLMRLNGFPIVPLLLGMILGPLLEQYLMRAIRLSSGELSYFIGGPTTWVLWLLLIGLVVLAAVKAVVTARKAHVAKQDALR